MPGLHVYGLFFPSKHMLEAKWHPYVDEEERRSEDKSQIRWSDAAGGGGAEVQVEDEQRSNQ